LLFLAIKHGRSVRRDRLAPLVRYIPAFTFLGGACIPSVPSDTCAQ